MKTRLNNTPSTIPQYYINININPPPYFIVIASSVKTKKMKVFKLHRIVSKSHPPQRKYDRRLGSIYIVIYRFKIFGPVLKYRSRHFPNFGFPPVALLSQFVEHDLKYSPTMSNAIILIVIILPGGLTESEMTDAEKDLLCAMTILIDGRLT